VVGGRPQTAVGLQQQPIKRPKTAGGRLTILLPNAPVKPTWAQSTEMATMNPRVVFDVPYTNPAQESTHTIKSWEGETRTLRDAYRFKGQRIRVDELGEPLGGFTREQQSCVWLEVPETVSKGENLTFKVVTLNTWSPAKDAKVQAETARSRGRKLWGKANEAMVMGWRRDGGSVLFIDAELTERLIQAGILLDPLPDPKPMEPIARADLNYLTVPSVLAKIKLLAATPVLTTLFSPLLVLLKKIATTNTKSGPEALR
jgi:hypothetical protein